MANEHPFQMLFETLGRLPIAHADSVNRQAYEILYDILSVPVEKAGRCILLRAPRAGHGKTHLLSRIQHHLGASHEFIPLHATFGSQIDAASVIDDALRRLLRPLPASGGLSVLDLVVRRLFASALQPLVGSGEVPCQDREGALTALRTRPIETFDFHHPNAVTAHWARENFEVLGQRLSMELAQRSNLPIREVSFWVDALFRFGATPVENPSRLRVLGEVVHAGNPGDGVLMERLEALLGLLAQLMRVVLVADDLEGFSTDETAALRLAAFLGALRQSVERLDVILSLNQDIWQSAFVPRLSGGLADRLSEVVVELNPLTEDEMVALLESRVPGLGARVLSRVDRNSAGSHARGLIRAAGTAWLRASAMDSQPAVSPVLPPAAAVLLPRDAHSFVASEPVRLEKTPEPQPALVASETPSVEVPSQQQVAAPAELDDAPDPTRAIAFLAAEVAHQTSPESWPAPGFSASPPVAPPPAPPVPEFVPQSPFESAGSDPVLEPEAVAPAPQSPEATVWIPAVESPFQAPAVPQPPVFTPAETQPVESNYPVYESSPVVDFQPASTSVLPPAYKPVPETPSPPAFQSIPEAASPPVYQAISEPVSAPVFQETPEFVEVPVFHAAPEPESQPIFPPAPEPAAVPVEEGNEEFAQPAAPDTDRVDDLLRQFRERYGRGSL